MLLLLLEPFHETLGDTKNKSMQLCYSCEVARVDASPHVGIIPSLFFNDGWHCVDDAWMIRTAAN